MTDSLDQAKKDVRIPQISKVEQQLSSKAQCSASNKSDDVIGAPCSDGEDEDDYAASFQEILNNLRHESQEDALSSKTAQEERFPQYSNTFAPLRDARATKLRELNCLDHSKIKYLAIRKDIYVPSPDISTLSDQDVRATLEEMDHTKIKGTNPQRPIAKWYQCGFDETITRTLADLGYQEPFPVQRACIPCLLSGRDLMCLAQTGSGKTLAYCLPMLRHVRTQPPLELHEGPIALILVCTRELAQQIGKCLESFCVALKFKLCVTFGGESVSKDISSVREGCHIIVCTPGRLMELLVANRGKVLSLRRTSFVVLDEADRLFDEGFGIQIRKIFDSVRPDRQCAMFSATMPSFIQRAAKRFLMDPLWVSVGSRISVSKNVIQAVECFEKDEERFLRLLELLGDHVNKNCLVLVFVERKSHVEDLHLHLQKFGYDCASLHSGMDSVDRKISLQDFNRTGDRFAKAVLIATGVAARGLDLLNLDLVINYTTPPCLEEYIHRVGRTGRAGKKGNAVTFLLHSDDAKHAIYLQQALRSSDHNVPEWLEAMAAEEYAKVHPDSKGVVVWNPIDSQSHYGGRGYKFDAKESRKDRKRKRMEQKELMTSIGLDESSDSEVYTSDEKDADKTDWDSTTDSVVQGVIARTGREVALTTGDAKSRALAVISALNEMRAQEEAMASKGIFFASVDLNECSSRIRRKATSRQAFADIQERTTTTITVRGEYMPPSRRRSAGREPLHLRIEGSSKDEVQNAARQIKGWMLENEDLW